MVFSSKNFQLVASEGFIFPSLSYFISESKIQSEISPDAESVAIRGFSLDGFEDIARCKVELKSGI